MSSSRTHRGQGYEDPSRSAKGNASRQEDRLIQLIEAKGTIERYETLLKKISDGSKGVPDFFKAATIDALVVTADIMLYGDSDKVRLEASKDILDRAGHNKTQKVSLSGSVQVDHDTSKMELINLIISSARRAGLPVRDSDSLPAPSSDLRTTTIDVTPVATADKPPAGV
jgi:hypothetical protein